MFNMLRVLQQCSGLNLCLILKYTTKEDYLFTLRVRTVFKMDIQKALQHFYNKSLQNFLLTMSNYNYQNSGTILTKITSYSLKK